MADRNYLDLWNESLSLFKDDVGEEEFNFWHSKLDYIRAEETEIFVAIPTSLILELFSSKYLKLLTEKLTGLCGESIKINLEIHKKENIAEENPEKSEKEPESIAVNANANTNAAKNREEKKNSPQLQEEYTFETFVVGEINNYAYNAALAVSRNPGNSKMYNPLLIYGGTGLGKTHLMQSIGHFIHHNSDQKILYITGNGFLSEFVGVMQSGPKSKDAFTKKYRNVDVLLIDDIHNIERGAGTQDELFYIFEALYNKKKQMVFTCDRPINELKNMAPRLQSRFRWGLNVELQLPKYEELIAILKKKMEIKKAELKKDINISDEIIELIIKNISSNVRDMEGALNTLIGYADLVNKPVTMEIAQRELKDKFADPKQGNLSIEMIQKVVAESFNLIPNDLKGKKRTAGKVRARHIAIYLSRELTENSLTEIGQSFGDRDHTTIMHSHRLINEESRSDPNLYTILENLKKTIKELNVK